MWVDLVDQNRRILSHINVLQKVLSTEEALNDQMQKMTIPLTVSQLLSMATSLLSQWARE